MRMCMSLRTNLHSGVRRLADTAFRLLLVASVIGVLAAPVSAGQDEPGGLDQAFSRLYNFDFPSAHTTIDAYIASHSDDPFGYGVRALCHLFYELHRLGILEAEYFINDSRLRDKKKLKPDPAVRRELFRAIAEAQSRATATLAVDPHDRNALFTMCMTEGVGLDYTSLVEKKHMSSLSFAKRSNRYAQRLLELDPGFHDARLTTGFTEYLVGSLPFFVRWFVRFDNVRGNKEQGMENLRLVARSGHYLRPFAKFLLAMVCLREKRPHESRQLLAELAREYPDNPLVHKELLKLSTHLRIGRKLD